MGVGVHRYRRVRRGKQRVRATVVLPHSLVIRHYLFQPVAQYGFDGSAQVGDLLVGFGRYLGRAAEPFLALFHRVEQIFQQPVAPARFAGDDVSHRVAETEHGKRAARTRGPRSVERRDGDVLVLVVVVAVRVADESIRRTIRAFGAVRCSFGLWTARRRDSVLSRAGKSRRKVRKIRRRSISVSYNVVTRTVTIGAVSGAPRRRDWPKPRLIRGYVTRLLPAAAAAASVDGRSQGRGDDVSVNCAVSTLRRRTSVVRDRRRRCCVCARNSTRMIILIASDLVIILSLLLLLFLCVPHVRP